VGGEDKYHCIIGGDPCFIVHPSDMAVCLMALDSKVVIYEKNQKRTIPLDDFFVLPEDNPHRENILKAGQIITSIRVPLPGKKTITLYEKVRERQSWDFSIVSVAMSLELVGNIVKKGKIVLGGVAPKPWTDKSVNDALKNLKLDTPSITKFSNSILKDAEPMERNNYKVQMVRNLVQHLLQNAV
jgi:xanthine dehydrogenase YagS FAD-binding subunit